MFAYPPAQGGHARIRIFTPARELPFAGHPVLGGAFVVGTAIRDDEVRLETGMGLVPIRLERDGRRVTFGWMTQPRPSIAPFSDTGRLFAALGVDRSVLPVECYDNGVKHIFVAIEDADAVARLAPDLGRSCGLCRSSG